MFTSRTNETSPFPERNNVPRRTSRVTSTSAEHCDSYGKSIFRRSASGGLPVSSARLIATLSFNVVFDIIIYGSNRPYVLCEKVFRFNGRTKKRQLTEFEKKLLHTGTTINEGRAHCRRTSNVFRRPL